ncbi:MAG: acyltransferase [Chloroflexota bacterium]
MRAKLLNFLWGMEEVSLLVQRQPERYLKPLLKAFGAIIADDAHVGEGLLLVGVNRAGYTPLKIGRKAYFGRRIMVDFADEVVFGDYSAIGNDTRFFCHTDLAHSPLVAELYPVTIGPIHIGRGVFVGPNSTVANGVRIGECSVIGANSVVLRDIPPYSLATGAPAKVVRELDRTKIPAFDREESFIIPEGTT